MRITVNRGSPPSRRDNHTSNEQDGTILLRIKKTDTILSRIGIGMRLKQRKQEIFPIEKSWKTDTDHEIEKKKTLSTLTI